MKELRGRRGLTGCDPREIRVRGRRGRPVFRERADGGEGDDHEEQAPHPQLSAPGDPGCAYDRRNGVRIRGRRRPARSHAPGRRDLGGAGAGGDHGRRRCAGRAPAARHPRRWNRAGRGLRGDRAARHGGRGDRADGARAAVLLATLGSRRPGRATAGRQAAPLARRAPASDERAGDRAGGDAQRPRGDPARSRCRDHERRAGRGADRAPGLPAPPHRSRGQPTARQELARRDRHRRDLRPIVLVRRVPGHVLRSAGVVGRLRPPPRAPGHPRALRDAPAPRRRSARAGADATAAGE